MNRLNRKLSANSSSSELPLRYSPAPAPASSPTFRSSPRKRIKKSLSPLAGRLRALQLIVNSISSLISPPMQCILSLLGLIGVPLIFYGGYPISAPGGFFPALRNAWDSLLHTSIYLVTTVTLVGAVCVVCTSISKEDAPIAFSNASQTVSKWQKLCRLLKFLATPARLSICIILVFLQLAGWASYQQVVSPGWLANPFLILSGYKIYWPKTLGPALEGLCPNYKLGEASDRDPLCLSPESWEVLSAGVLSSSNQDDVRTVLEGLSFAQQYSGGLIVSVMGRDVREHIEPLRLNVESLVPFFPKISVVIFENDSKDGSREYFTFWAEIPGKGYDVDLIDCPEADNCEFGKSHRYDAEESHDFFMSSTIGEMHHFRQRTVDYITSSESYKDYSHMLLMDLDIGVGISPLGVLHSLGSTQDSAIASSCRQPWPGGLGSLVPPYDFNAFESIDTKETRWLKSLQERFCGLLPAGDRWRFVCEAASPMKFLQIIQLDRANDHPYPVVSAYNGATLYPLKLVRENEPKYDAGDDGQRCEHISFNRGLKKPMFVNPKWDMHMSPTLPGGPKGEQALRHIRRFSTLPRIAIPLFLMNSVPLSILVLSVMFLAVNSMKKAYSLVTKQDLAGSDLTEDISPSKRNA